ncbi:MAG TPA: tetratricopeptide repeat protein, partial [Pirellulales bacterium]
MNERPLPSPGSEPEPSSLESLEQQLRALSPPKVPADLSSRLVSAIPGSIGIPHGSGLGKSWIWIIAAAGTAIIVGSALVYRWLGPGNANLVTGDHAVKNSTNEPQPGTTSYVLDSNEKAVEHDPYNAGAWFKLAKAQADQHRSVDAISSAEKAIDVAHSRNQN